MTNCIAVTNQKGGVGKSSISNALGAGLFNKGYKILYIDLDAQGNLSYSLNSTAITEKLNTDKKELTSLTILEDPSKTPKAIIHTQQGDLIPASSFLANADIKFNSIPVGREYKLKEAIDKIKDRYDYIILDTPPSLGILTINALSACTSVLIPSQADIYSIQGIQQLANTIENVRKYSNKKLKISGIVLTRYNSRSVLTQDVTDMLNDLAASLNTKVYKTKIRECIAIKEAQITQQDIFAYAPKSNAAKDFEKFINEFLS